MEALSSGPTEPWFPSPSQGQDRPSTAPRVCNGIYRFSLSSVFLNLRGFLLATVLRPTSGECPPQSNAGSTWPAPPQRGHPWILQDGSRPHASLFSSVPWMRCRVETALLWLTAEGACFQKPKYSFPLLFFSPFFPFSLWLPQLSFIVAYNLEKKKSSNFFSCNSLMSSELPNGFPCTLSCPHVRWLHWL